MAPKQVLRFDTKITVLNRALGHAVDKRWPVATAQWAAGSLFEIDEIAGLPTPGPTERPAGLAWVTICAQRGLDRPLHLGAGAWLEVCAVDGGNGSRSG